MHIGAVELPKSLVLKRWTVSAREGVENCIPGYSDAAKLSADYATMHGVLHASAMELVLMGTTSRQAFEVAVDYMSHAKAAIAAMTVKDPQSVQFAVQTAAGEGAEPMQFDSAIAAPPRVRSRGRPKELRFKSPIESPGAIKKPPFSKPKNNLIGSDNPRRSTRFLKTGVYILEHCGYCGSTEHRTGDCEPENEPAAQASKRRSCKSCGAYGHNRSTCGRKSTYVAK